MALTSASAGGGTKTYVTTSIALCSSCTLENCFCGAYISGVLCSRVIINGVTVATPQGTCSPNLQPVFLNKGTTICSSGTSGSILLTGYFFD